MLLRSTSLPSRPALWLCVLGFAAASLLPLPARAQDGASYVISGNDGYGIADCMHSGSDCGRLIADSWCESHGHAHALTYGSAEDVTGAIAEQQPVLKVAAGDVIIRCGD